MAKLKTIKNGELFLMKDGSTHTLVSAALPATSDVFGFVTSSQSTVAYAATDLYVRNGNNLLSGSFAASSSLVLNLTHPIVRPVVHVVGDTVHMWYGYDPAGGTAYLLYYVNSSDAGATWGTPAVAAALGAGGTWNDVSIVPAGVRYVDSDTTYLFVVGLDGSTFTLGRYTIDTSGGSLSSEYADAANYSQYGSNPITGSVSSSAIAVLYADGKYHMWTPNSGTATIIYHHTSQDGLAWNVNQSVAATGRVSLRAGVSGTLDDASMRIGRAWYREGWYYLFYLGNDGSSSKAMVAIGRDPNRLVKVGNLNTLTGSDLLARPGFAADLTYTAPDQHVHIPDRNRPGVLADASFEPMDVAFTFKFEGMRADGTTATGDAANIMNRLLKSTPSVRESVGVSMTKTSFNILYRLDGDSAGTKDDFYLFLDCHPLTTQISEQDNGTTVTATIRCYGANQPLIGRY